MINRKITISGIVQGVGFRYYARMIAQQYSISGYVKNLPDGSVFVEAEGSADQVEKFINWCYNGPISAEVTNVNVEEGNIKNYSDFEIIAD
jgi:acylphosphatase